MIGIIAMSIAVAAGAMPQRIDTAVAVARGAKLHVEAQAGSVVVDTWKRDEVRVTADRPSDAVDVHYGGGEVSVETDRGGESVDYRITVPEWMDVHIETLSSGVRVDGAGGEVVVSSTEGGIHVDGGRRFVSLTSVSGAIEVSDARARVQAQTLNDGITLRAVTGDVGARTVNGSITMSDVNSTNIRASTVDGAISFHGSIRPSGFYRLSSHNGRVSVFVSRLPDATISVTSFNGAFDTDFPLRLTSMSEGRHMTFTVGTGSARLELDSFNGAVALKRAGGERNRK